MPSTTTPCPKIHLLRLDAYCAQVFPVFTSRNQARKAIKEKRLLVNGESARTDWFPKAEQDVGKVPESPTLPLLKMDPDVFVCRPAFGCGVQAGGHTDPWETTAARFIVRFGTTSR